MKLIVLSLIAASCAAQALPRNTAPDPIPTYVQIPLTAQASTAANTPANPPFMQAQVFKPKGPGPFKILLYAHGRPAYASQRAQLHRPLHARHIHYWLRKGYAVVAPIRPGYGTPPRGTGGPDRESSGVGYSANGQCIRPPQPATLAANAAAAQRAALDWVRGQPWARAQHILLEGQSGGGLATVALCADPAAPALGVKGCINFSGGAGGDPQHAPGQVCAPEKIATLMQSYGRTTHAPSLWLYAPNDLYWGPTAPQQWHQAFNQSATSAPSTFYQSPPIGSDGHSLQRAGSTHWAPVLDAWLKKNNL